MSKSINQFFALMKKNDKLSENCWAATTAKRKTVIIPTGFSIFDTDQKITYTGDGSSYGGITANDKEDARLIVTAAASAFTSNDTFKTIASSASAVFTSNTHGFVTGDVIIPMATDATYKLTQDLLYTVTKINANTFTLTTSAGAAVAAEDQTANLVVKKYSLANNNVLTWAEATYLRTGDAVTATNSTGTLPSGLSNATAYYVIKDDIAANGGADGNTLTTFKLASSRNNALAGTAITIRDAGTTGFKLVSTNAYLRNRDKVVLASTGAAIDVFLPSAVTSGVGARYEVANSGATNCTVKSVAGKVNNVAAGTGVVLKANSFDFIGVVSDGTDWQAVQKQVTP